MAKTHIGDGLLSATNYVIISVFTLLCIYPFYYVIISSISDPAAVSRGVYLVPAGISLATYRGIFERQDLLGAYIVSISRTVLGTCLCVVCSSMLAYLVTKKEMIARRLVYRFVITTLYLNVGLIPWYLTMKAYGLRNSFLLYIIPGTINAFYLILVKTYIEQLPASLEESASIEGAGIFTIFSRIIMPLSKPIVATVTVYCAVAQWNSWTDNYFLVSVPRLQTVQMILYQYLNSAQTLADSMRSATVVMPGAVPDVTPQSVQMAIIVISVLPILVVYPVLQKYFAKGIMLGAIKG
jgi:putative aldouronate transport system permease protein